MISVERIAELQRELAELSDLRAENKRLREALEEISSCVQLLGLDGWSDAPHVMNVITKALSETR